MPVAAGSPAPPSKEDVVAEFRRRSLVQAACRVFGEKGFDLATVDAIAEAAKVAKGTVYLYYPSKQAIYDAAFTAGMAELEESSLQRIGRATTAREAIHSFVSARIEYFQEHPDFFRLYMTEVARQVAAKARGSCHLAVDRQTRALQKTIEKAVANGEVRGVDPEAAALAVFDITRGLVGRRLLIGSKSSAQRDIEFLTDLVWTGLRPARGQKK
jgi:AcrR family transcriptional regulator